MINLLVVCAGGALGSGVRYAIAQWTQAQWGISLPIGTFLVNAIGSFAICFVAAVAGRTLAFSPLTYLFFTTGILGGFTTYSAFNLELVRFASADALLRGVAYAALTLVTCFALGVLGQAVGRAVVSG